MLVVMRPNAAQTEVEGVLHALERRGMMAYVFQGRERVVITGLGDETSPAVAEALEVLPGVERAARLASHLRLASRESHPEDTVVSVGAVQIGFPAFTLVAGTAITHRAADRDRLAAELLMLGVQVYRAGSPAEGRPQVNLPVLLSVTDPREVDDVAAAADMLLVRSQDMQNEPLVQAVARVRRPVLLERGTSATVLEWLLVAEMIMREGNFNVVLCERGIRTYEADRAATLDLSSVPVVRRMSHLPILVNPSEGTGHRYMVQPMALAAAASGADGLVLDVHLSDTADLSEGPHSLSLPEFGHLLEVLRPVVEGVGRQLRMYA